MGAEVLGYALKPDTNPNHFSMPDLPIESVIGDIRDMKHLTRVFDRFQPEIIYHLAAQALVCPSYDSPAKTFETNVMGTVNILEVCRLKSSVRAVINITSDKCYENRE